MADGKKQKKVRFTTPKGIAVFPWLDKPDTKFNPEGKYRVDLKLSAEDGEALNAKLQPIFDKVVKAAEKNPKTKGKRLKINDYYKRVVDDNGDETGEWLFSFKMTASGVRKDGTKWAMQPDLYDAAGQKLTSPVWGGSIIKVGFEVTEYDKPIGVGISLRLNAVQVIKLVTSGQRDASMHGFVDESEDEDSDIDTSSSDDSGGDDSDGDDDGDENF